MADEIETIAKQLYEQFPTKYPHDAETPQEVDWEDLTKHFPEQAEEYRKEAAKEIAGRTM